MDHGLKCKIIKLLEKKILRENPQDLELGKEFLALTPKPEYMKGKTDELDLIKIKKLRLCEQLC